ncbi:MAG: hypothetical protein FWE95_11975 [Planctomycetaceae bacterium]|nr:hypothetical protein [Planctomycetaceae bacterium]
MTKNFLEGLIKPTIDTDIDMSAKTNTTYNIGTRAQRKGKVAAKKKRATRNVKKTDNARRKRMQKNKNTLPSNLLIFQKIMLPCGGDYPFNLFQLSTRKDKT